jgi:hypothetical protein
MEQPKQITVTGNIVLSLTSDQMNVVLRGLEQLPFGQVRPVFTAIEQQIIAQVQEKDQPKANNPDKILD